MPEYIPGNLIAVDEWHEEEVPNAYCFRCDVIICKSYVAWICYECYDNFREKAILGYGDPMAWEQLALAEAVHGNHRPNP